MSNNTSSIQVLISDDHPLCIDGLKKIISVQGMILIGVASNGAELIELAFKLKPDIILTDVFMPQVDGITATKIINAQFPEIGIIALSVSIEASVILDMLHAGAKGYLLKSVQPSEIIEAIKNVCNGGNYYCKEIAEFISKNHSDNITSKKKDEIHFSTRETEVIKLICNGNSSKEIAQQLSIGKRTVEWHREQILHKIGAKNTAGIVTFAIKHHIY